MRKEGYYWVRREPHQQVTGEWEIAKWCNRLYDGIEIQEGWALADEVENTLGWAHPAIFSDRSFIEINENRIPEPGEGTLKKDTQKPYRRDIENIQVGDIAFDECVSSMGTGGYMWDSGETVIAITDAEIITLHPYENEVKYFDRKTLNRVKTEQTAYYLHGFQNI